MYLVKNEIAQKRIVELLFKIFSIAGVILVMGLSAHIRIYLPFSPVPITGQTLIIFLSAAFFKKNLSILSQLLYILFAMIGLPLISQNNAGISVLIGPTGGYLIGFVLSTYFIGYLFEKKKNMNFLSIFTIFLMANLLIYFFGAVQLYFWTNNVIFKNVSFIKLVNIGVIPFLIGDFLKIYIAAFTITLFKRY